MMKIQEIAKQAGVSTATVSRVFGHHPNIRPEVREKVLAAAHRFHWRPRCSSKQRNIVVITPGHALFPCRTYVETVISELSSELAKREYRVELLPAENLDRLPLLTFCGVVAAGLSEKNFADWDSRFESPLILADVRVSGKQHNVFSVASDEMQGMELAIRYLAGKGCSRIGSIVYGEPGMEKTDIRRHGILTALEKLNLTCEDALIRTAWSNDYVETTGKLLKAGVDALFCPGGDAGIITAYALSLYGKSIPDDISLIASEHDGYSGYTTPPQTTISQDYAALAASIAELLDRSLDGGKNAMQTLIPYHLIERNSVR